MENKKKIIAYKCKNCSELFEKKLCSDHTIESNHYDFEPVYKDEKEITRLQCLSCEKLLALGTCGEHRIETGHEEFIPIYTKIEEKNDTF